MLAAYGPTENYVATVGGGGVAHNTIEDMTIAE